MIREADDVKKSVQQAESACTRAKQALVRHQREQRDHRLAEQTIEDNIERLKSELDKDTIDAGALDALKEQLRQAEEDVLQHSASYQDAINAKDVLNDDARAFLADLTAATAEKQEGEAKITKTAGKLAKLENTRQNALRGKNDALQLIETAKRGKEEAERDRQGKVDSINTEYIPSATKIHARVPVEAGMTLAAIDKRLDTLLDQKKDFEDR